MESFVEFLVEYSLPVFLSFLVLILGTLFALVCYSGLFAPVEIKTSKPPIGTALLAYKDGRGPYSNTGSFYSETCSIAPEKKCLGIYYDDPGEVCLSFFILLSSV